MMMVRRDYHFELCCLYITWSCSHFMLWYSPENTYCNNPYPKLYVLIGAYNSANTEEPLIHNIGTGELNAKPIATYSSPTSISCWLLQCILHKVKLTVKFCRAADFSIASGGNWYERAVRRLIAPYGVVGIALVTFLLGKTHTDGLVSNIALRQITLAHL